ncbi:MAG: isoleucine--tRNA ligase [Magnetococcus sp. DMHC-6]
MASDKDQGLNYKETVHLPKTQFPMRASLPTLEPGLLKKWQEMDLYRLLRQQSQGRKSFILHDGPPYANGHLHMGHAINKVLKDVIVKSRQMMGYDANYVPGWDCHGLPIETKVEQEFKKKGIKKEQMNRVEFRRSCREFATTWVDIQKKEFVALGVIGDWEHPYLTMDYRFEAQIVRELGRFLINGGLYKGFKPVYWCVNDTTALAEAEVEYQDHTSTTVYVKFPLAPGVSLPGVENKASVSVVIWTTTPWTLPGNLAVCLHGQLDYIAVEIGDPNGIKNIGQGEILIVAEGLWKEVAQVVGISVEQARIVAHFKGHELEGKRFRHPYLDQDAPIVLGDHVTLEAGTGCVHTAPGHGSDDYLVGLAYGLEPFNPVDDHGLFVANTPHFAGQHVFKANAQIVDYLDSIGALLHRGSLVHSYPHCWRCHDPVITRATPQWFISMETNELRQKALQAIAKTRWIPSWGEERIHNMVVARPDWCVSRQRAWGVPITILSCEGCGTGVTSDEVLEGIVAQVAEFGADVWFERPAADFLPKGFLCPQCGGGTFIKESDILDVWFDSGVTHAAVLEQRSDLHWPADLYLEGSDQHRGWFHSSLLASVGTRGAAPYEAVLTHGFVVDGKGRKMSKSLGNVVAPDKIIQQYGADILRLWVTAEDYSGDIRISDEILKGLSDNYRRIRNTVRFLLSNLDGFDPKKSEVAFNQMPPLDRWALDRLARLIARVIEAYESYGFHRVYQDLHYFCSVDMGAFYLDIIKDCLYCEETDSLERRSTLTVLHHVLHALVRLMAPIFSFTAEEIWSHMNQSATQLASIHLADFPKLQPQWCDDGLAVDWERLRKVRGVAYRLLENERIAKRMGSFMEAEVTLFAKPELLTFLQGFDRLEQIFIVAGVHVRPLTEAGDHPLSSEVEGLAVRITRAEGQKCERCWNWHPGVGNDQNHPSLCPRCVRVVNGMVWHE